MKRSTRWMLACWAVAGALACSGDDGGDDNGTGGSSSAPKVTFTKDVHPIMQMKCGLSDCHDDPDNFFLPGHGVANVDIAYKEATETGSAGVPIYERILMRVASTSGAMPPDCEGGLGKPGCLTQAEYDLIEAWVEAGHPK